MSVEKAVIRLNRKQKPHVYMFTLGALYQLPSRAWSEASLSGIHLSPSSYFPWPLFGKNLAASAYSRTQEPMDVVGDTRSKVRR
jgi:hypothetical protein